ncbi:MAG TPA: hypothetical protein VIL85_22470 [Thermomicrobiales bacterium]|jgi:hypothetical protein
MMESLTDQLRNVSLEATIAFAGQTVTVRYRSFASEITAFRAVAEQDRTRAMVDDLLEQVLVSWDRVHADGSPLPLTREAFTTLPRGFRTVLLAHLGVSAQQHRPEDTRPPRRKRSR